MSSNATGVLSDFQAATDLGTGVQRLPGWFSRVSTRRVVFWTIVVVLGFVQMWSHRLLVDHDGVAYLDIAENYARGAWAAALNGFYSPLYSWLMAIPLYLLKVPRSWEATVLHLVNFTGYLGAYATFEFLLTQLFRTRHAADSKDQLTGLPESAWHTLGLAIFLYSTLTMANISGHSGQGTPGSTPDIFVLFFVFLAAGLLLRMQSGEAQWSTYAFFGAVLGFGYLAKTAMFPLSFVFLGVAGLLTLRQRKNVGAFLLAPVCFALVAGPWIAVLSHANGRFLYGDAGRLTYRWLAGPRANPVEWAGQIQDGEIMVHPPRQLSVDPPVYEFATPIPGTFPLWYGNSYWLEGEFHFSREGQMRILHQSYSLYWEILEHQKEFLVLLLILVLLQGTVLRYSKSFLAGWVLWMPATAALGMYSLVRVEPRYVAAFLVVLWISLFAAVRLPKGTAQQFALWAVVATALATGAGILHASITDFHAVLRGAPSEQVEVAAGLRKLGILEGQSLATIGIPRDSFYWARLAHVRVISEIPSPNVNQYWLGSPATQERVRSLFAQTGAVAIVTDTMPATIVYPESGETLRVPGWQQIGNTSYYLFPLRTLSSVSTASADAKVPHEK